MVMNLTSTASALALKETLKKPKCKSPLDSLWEILETLWELLVTLLEILGSPFREPLGTLGKPF